MTRGPAGTLSPQTGGAHTRPLAFSEELQASVDILYNDDPGRGEVTECAARAIAIASGDPYLDVYTELVRLAHSEDSTPPGSRRHTVRKRTIRRYMQQAGYRWVPTLGEEGGYGAAIHPAALPASGIVVSLVDRLVAVISGVTHDTHYSPDERLHALGYWVRRDATSTARQQVATCEADSMQ